jgi:hypothetical protein
VIAKQTQGAESIAGVRQALCSNSTDISYASMSNSVEKWPGNQGKQR